MMLIFVGHSEDTVSTVQAETMTTLSSRAQERLPFWLCDSAQVCGHAKHSDRWPTVHLC